MTGQFGFLPWMQRGLINRISQIEGTSIYSERAQLSVTATPTVGPAITKTVYLIGPGDVLGIDPNIIVRTQPDSGVFNFDENLMAYIEFAEVDFLWRYTPAKANSYNQLHPWLALVVLQDGEATLGPPVADGLPPILTVKPGTGIYYSNYFHPQNEHWAWGHIQVNDGSTVTSAFEADLINNPTAGISRLICPRKLAPATQYTAYLIPAFETGRQVGCGADETTLGGIPSLQPSWTASSSVVSGPNQFPVYFSWRFGTSALGDFETLARALVPQPMSASLGGIKMDISNSGMGLNGLFSPPVETVNTVNMEGALMPQTYVPPAPLTLSTITGSPLAPFTNGLLNILNLATNIRQSTYSSSAYSNPFAPAATFASDDPVILPPIYGQWHANVQSITTTPPTPTWVQQLNLDARYRAAAGLGAKVIYDNKQHFMELAWDQVGEVLTVNDKINKAMLAKQASSALYTKHLVANTKMTSAVATTSMNYITQVGTQLFKKVKVVSSFSGTSTASYSMNTVASRSYLTKGTVNSGFRKLVRNRGFAVNKLGIVGLNQSQLINNLSIGSNPLKAAPALMTKPITVPTSSFSGLGVAGATTMGSISGFAMAAMAIPLLITTTYTESFGNLQTMLAGYDVYEASQPTPAAVSVSPIGVVNDVQSAVDPSITIPARVTQQIDLEYNGLSALSPFNKVMAYPIIDESAYEYLLGISADYLLPNLSQYPNNIVTMLVNNNALIEAYMAGLNHQFSKELLWQGYPTDQRGSYFRRFWDINDTLPGATSDFLYDIDMIHTWTHNLGSNNTTSRLYGLTPNFMTILVKGDLLKKFPNALIYIQKATWDTSPPAHALVTDDSSLFHGSPPVPNPAYLQFPMFRSTLDGAVMLAFDITPAQAIGVASPPTDPGWFLVFRERSGEHNFGMADPPALSSPPTGAPFYGTWDNINWAFMNNGTSNFATAQISGFGGGNPLPVFDASASVHWNVNSNSANIASILFQDPVIVAIHAESLVYT